MQRFRHTENVCFQDHQNFEDYNQHPLIAAYYPTPRFTSAFTPVIGAGFSSEVVDSRSSGWIVTDL
jgi:hypothetical protein